MFQILKRASALLALVAMTQNADAISLRFKFKVFSSGPSMYACNAGLRSPALNKQVCYFEGTTNTCTPNSCADGTVCHTRCICSGDNGGDYLMNYFSVTHSDWKDNGTTGDTNVTRVTGQGDGNWKTALDEQTSWKKRIKELSFNLGSELYGAEYFVDICYRGPQIEYFEDGVLANFSFGAQASATDFLATGVNPGDNSRDGLVIPGTVDGKKYTELAGLKVQAFLVCDQQGIGTYKLARNNVNAYNTTDTSAAFKLGSNGVPTGAFEAADHYSASSYSSISASALDLFGGSLGQHWITANGQYTPRFCKVRYLFKETNASQATGVNLRKWQRHGAELCTYTDIEEGEM